MDELLEYGCIDFKKLLILKAKSMKLSDQECYVLLLIMTLDEIGIKPITPSQIHKICSLSLQQIDETLIALVDHHYIARMNGSLDLRPIENLLLNQKSEEVQEVDLVSVFEDAFGRSLSQREVQLINSLKCQGHSDDMIIDALDESVKSGVITFRYIEKILDNWAKYGVKRRYAPQPIKQENIDVEQRIKDYKWWENDE
ncbi:MAG: DnaD domain protein [Longibaculum muris]|uniref:DnaD/phage-associated family protein n=1 Tax=Longibaculum muris TaxID=1796628 RepID=A0A4R3YH56_9FIRM|nr:DnaD domain protein [Longibaculum muris]KXU49199.1 DnaD domain protein [Candidatus Stoquefichus sp. KLE1796]MCR1889305.1 DnaD domain protein [Longibaculum muris]MED9811351.1 DnaD domain protein [Longibaculum muris]TCV91381.1 DnaD/phage-associated family protein [Longibaculum muris]